MNETPAAPPPVRVLHLEDDPLDAELVRDVLDVGGVASGVLHVNSRARFESALAQGAFDLIICDFNFPGFDGLAALKLAKERCPDVPVIIVSGAIDPGDVVRCLKEGATDFLLKQRLERLPSAVTRAIAEAKQHRQQREVEAALRRSEAFSRAVLDSLATQLAVLDAHGVIVATNRAWRTFASENGGAGYVVDAIGTSYLSPVEAAATAGDQSAQAALDGILGVLSGARETFLLEYPCHSPDKQRWFAMHVQPRSDGRGGAVVAHQDITDRLELESQIRQAQKMESLGRLTGGIAHDFNNLLTVINGTSELALRELGDTELVRTDLEDIRRAGERAATLTRQLLAFSRQQILEPRVMNFNVAVAGMESLLRRLLGENIDLTVVLGADVANVMADPGQIEQVITNLAVNARDAMPGGGHLVIETKNVTIDESYASRDDVAVSPGPYARLTVSDSGVGMDEATRARIFEPFFTTKELGKGTGLGMSTVYGIVKQSHGFITVSSGVGQGTSFSINLPQEHEADLADGRGLTTTSNFGVETILVVEDNEGLRKLTRRVLEPAGYTVIAAATGEEALDALERRHAPVHLLLTDIVMPGISGRHLAERLALSSSATKVLYMSGYTDDTIVRYGVLEAQMPFLSKPFTSGELLRKVREVLDS